MLSIYTSSIPVPLFLQISVVLCYLRLSRILREKSLLERIKKARRYNRDTGKVLHIIEVSCDDNSLILSDDPLFLSYRYVGSALTRDLSTDQPIQECLLVHTWHSGEETRREGMGVRGGWEKGTLKCATLFVLVRISLGESRWPIPGYG